MIPILFEQNTLDFSTNGICRLPDCTSCIVTEERNGIYECEFEYPVNGRHYNDITEGRIISVTHDDTGDRQPYEIYGRSEPIAGIVTFSAHHISYNLANVILKPFTAPDILTAFQGFKSNAITSQPFEFWTSKQSTGSFKITAPVNNKEILGGVDGSILDVFGGGEYEWDKYTVKLYQHRGSDNGVVIRYGKNLSDMTREYSKLGVYNAVVPYWSDTDGSSVVYGGIVYGQGSVTALAPWTTHTGGHINTETGEDIYLSYTIDKVVTLDLSSEFEEEPTVEALETRAAVFLANNTPWLPDENISVDFVAMWQTPEYEEIVPLQRVRLCDTVTVYHPQLKVSASLKCIKTVWNVLLEKYSSIELGKAKTSFADTINAQVEKTLEGYPSFDLMQAAIEHATELISGGLGGHVVFKLNADGQPEEILIMDTDNIATAVNVWRFNLGGLGHSHTGYNGPFDDVALTMDGQINATMITAGILNANIIKAGIISDVAGNNWWNIITGEISLGSTASLGGYTGDSIRQSFEEQSDIISEAQENTNALRRYININPQVPSITIGTGENTYVEIGSEEMDFVQDGNTTVSITNQEATIPTVNVTTLNMQTVDATTGETVGDLFWVARLNGHLSLKVRG